MPYHEDCLVFLRLSELRHIIGADVDSVFTGEWIHGKHQDRGTCCAVDPIGLQSEERREFKLWA